jgi:hypothetical protein
MSYPNPAKLALILAHLLPDMQGAQRERLADYVCRWNERGRVEAAWALIIRRVRRRKNWRVVPVSALGNDERAAWH